MPLKLLFINTIEVHGILNYDITELLVLLQKSVYASELFGVVDLMF